MALCSVVTLHKLRNYNWWENWKKQVAKSPSQYIKTFWYQKIVITSKERLNTKLELALLKMITLQNINYDIYIIVFKILRVTYLFSYLYKMKYKVIKSYMHYQQTVPSQLLESKLKILLVPSILPGNSEWLSVLLRGLNSLSLSLSLSLSHTHTHTHTLVTHISQSL